MMPVTDSKPTSDKPQTQATKNVQYVAPYPQQFEDDTIDLYELWNKKGLIIAVTVIAALGSVVYALQQPPIYKAEALLLPPKAKDVQSLNMKQNLREERQVGEIFTSLPIRLEVFTTFENNLRSRILQKKIKQLADGSASIAKCLEMVLPAQLASGAWKAAQEHVQTPPGAGARPL